MKDETADRQSPRWAPVRAIGPDELDALGHLLEAKIQSNLNDLATPVFQSLLVQRCAFHIAHREWVTATQSADVTWPTVCSSSNRALSGEDAWVFGLGEAVVRLFLSAGGGAKASIAAPQLNDLRAAEQELLRLLPPEEVEVADQSPDLVPVTFWCHAAMNTTRRKLPAVRWAEIERNYASSTCAQLKPLVEHPESRGEGKLLLWQGPPGTGKTYAVRALADAWRPWCEVHYVTDPEIFFGYASYMRDVLLAADGYYSHDPEVLSDDDAPDERWRLVVLEDTGELLGLDAKVDTGQGLSRLLNLVDGLLGQGLKLLVLLTTNEPIGKLHPAVVRPGRCAAIVEFERFSPQEANGWLEAHRHAPTATTALSLAELYDASRGGQPAARERVFGFG